MKKLEKNKGITLIALVITIIILLILAGISIATLTGENGLLTKATTAKENSLLAEETEIIKMAYASMLTDNKTDGLEISTSNLQKEINQLKTATVEEVDSIPDGSNVIENGVKDGIIGKIVMGNTYYMYLNKGKNNSLKEFKIELYSDYTYSELLETLTLNYDDSIIDIYSWFNSKYATEFGEWNYNESFHGLMVVAGHVFKYKNNTYSIEVETYDGFGEKTDEDILTEGKVFKAYKNG